MHAFEQHVYRRVLDGINRIRSVERHDTYVVSLWVNDEDDWPFTPTVRVGHNTNSVVAAATPRASSELEARWNFAFYQQNELALIAIEALVPAQDADPEGVRLRRSWIEDELGLEYREYDDWGPYDELSLPTPTDAFIELMVRVVQRLHREGEVLKVFGREVPVLIHELEYYDRIFEQNERANPPDSVDAFKTAFYEM